MRGIAVLPMILLLGFSSSLSATADESAHSSQEACVLRFMRLVSGDSAGLVRGAINVGITEERAALGMLPESLGRQRSSNWCWAACSQMLSNYLGVTLPQEAFVQKAFGGLVDQAASLPVMVDALSGWVVQGPRGLVVTQGELFAATDAGILQLLSNDRPAIVGLALNNGAHHAYLMTGMTYDVEPLTGGIIPRTVILRDPWPQFPSRKEISWSEFREALSGGGMMATMSLRPLEQ